MEVQGAGLGRAPPVPGRYVRAPPGQRRFPRGPSTPGHDVIKKPQTLQGGYQHPSVLRLADNQVVFALREVNKLL